MPIEKARKAQLQALGLPSDEDMIRRVRAFEIQSGMTHGEMADMAGLIPSSFRVFMSGAYNSFTQKDSNSLTIRARLKEALDRYELRTAAPMAGTHYSTSEYEMVRRSMYMALRQGTAFVVDGAPGTQKTYTFRRVCDEINASGEGRAVYVYARIDHAPQSFLVEACSEAGIPNRGNIDQLIRKLRFFLGSGRTLLLVDEAQHLNQAGLEVLRQLLDQPPYFGVVLGGSHDLSVRLKPWQMEQWRSRVRRTHLLKGLSESEAARILRAELGPMSAEDVAETVKDATTASKRFDRPYSYISARNLFYAIQDARAALQAAEPKTVPAQATWDAEKVEAIA